MRRLLALLLLACAACAKPVEQDDLSYDTRFGSSTTLDLFKPDSTTHDAPAVLLIHGGSWSGGGKGDFSNAANRLAQSGFVAATINYRLTPDGAFPRNVQDCLCALSFLRANAKSFGLDPNRVAVMGYSAGGHLASMVALASADPQVQPDCESGPTGPPRAVIDGDGPTDLTALGESQALDDYLGKFDDHADVWRDASPINHVARGAPPFLIVQGGGDWIVTDGQATSFRDALRGVGTDAEMLELNGGGHLLNPAPDGDEELEVTTDNDAAWMAIGDFLDRTVGKP